MRKKQLLARALHRLGITRIALYLRSKLIRELPVLVYHRILDISSEFRFDAELVDASVDHFRWQMQYLKKHFTPITFLQLKEYLDGNADLPPRPVIVSFDDGFDDNYHNAFPILKETGVPATLFLTTGHIGTDETFWYDWLAYLILNTSSSYFSITALQIHHKMPADLPGRRKILYACVEALKRVSNEQRLAVLKELSCDYGADYADANEEIKHMSKPLSWVQCQEMREAGIEFGSHSVSHPILTSLSSQELYYELAESKRVIEEKLNQKVIALAFPNGHLVNFNQEIIDLALTLGYDFCASYVGDINKLSNLNRGLLDRITPEPCNDRSVFSMSLALHGLLGR